MLTSLQKIKIRKWGFWLKYCSTCQNYDKSTEKCDKPFIYEMEHGIELKCRNYEKIKD